MVTPQSNAHPMTFNIRLTVSVGSQSRTIQQDLGTESATNDRVITVTWNQQIRRISVDGSVNEIKQAIMSAFSLRNNQTFWLEDMHNVVRSVNRDLPPGTYSLHLNDGITIMVNLPYLDENMEVETVEAFLLSADDLTDFLDWYDLFGLVEVNGNGEIVISVENLKHGAVYNGVNWDL